MRGIVHCTLRPDLIVRHATGLIITSWSNAHTHDAAHPPELALSDMHIYLAPELATDSETIEFDERADIYSLGVIAYEALTLASPTMPLLHRLPALPRGIAQLIERMTTTSALSRPSAAEVRAAAIELLEQTRPPELTDDADADGIVEEVIDVEHSQDLAAPELDPNPIPPVRESPSQPYTMRPRWTPAHSIYAPPLPPPPPSDPTKRR
jgi:serine/threonine protein kinase